MDKLLHKIANYLVMNIHSDIGPGLLRGKMGISIFLYHYSRYVNSSVYEDIADRIVDDILSNVNPDLPMDIYNGICGINIGLKHLAKHGYVEYKESGIGLSEMEKIFLELDSRRAPNKAVRFSLSDFCFASSFISENTEKHRAFVGNFIDSFDVYFSENKSDNAIPLFIINSLFYFLNKAQEIEEYSGKAYILKSEVLDFLFKKELIRSESKGNMRILSQLTGKMEMTRCRKSLFRKFNELSLNMTFREFIDNYLWQALLYGLHFDASFQKNLDLANETDTLLMSSISNPFIYQGLAGIGLFILIANNGYNIHLIN